MTAKVSGRMCVVAGCNNRPSDSVSVHVFPKEERQRAAWTRFVKLTRAEWSGPSNYTVICSAHFNPDCFEPQYSLMREFGMTVKRRLCAGSVPSIYPKRKRDNLNEAFLSSPTPERSVVAKRERNRVLAELLGPDQATEERENEGMDTGYMMVAADTLGPSGPDPATCNQHEEKKTTSCQTTGPRARSVRVQVSANLKEKGVQAELQPRMRSIGVQFNGRDDIPDSQSAQKPALTHDSSSSDQSMATPCDSEAASMYEPSGSSSDESRLDMEGEVPHNPLEERKFIVSEAQLLDLFNCCKMCHRFARADVQQVVGTMVRIVTECMFCGYSWQWCSQPSIGTIPAGNLALSASILFSGALAAKVLRVLQCMGIATISRRTFATHQSSILFPSIARVWNSQQMEYVRRCQQKGQALVIGGDGRADSPGHSAKYGSYSTIDLEEGIVIDIQLVQSNEVKNSNGMEKKGLERAIQWLQVHELQVGTIVTDRHLQIQKWIRENLPDTVHYYDVWHVAKGLKKKIVAASKLKDCAELVKWCKSLTNHMYWVAASTPDGNGEVMWAKWESVENHIHNVHTGHNTLFPTCAHSTLEGNEQKKKWLKAGSKASEKMSDLILSKQMKKDIPKLSPLFQTSQIEAFHSTINHFAPKMVSFSYHGMYCRLMMAAIHYNENASRSQATTRDGDLQYKISFPKFKQGDYSVRKVTVEPTYEYTSTLMKETLKSATATMLEPIACLPSVKPPPLCSAFMHPEKEEAVCNFKSRFCRKETSV